MGTLSRSLFGRLISFDRSLSTRLVAAHTTQEMVGGAHPTYMLSSSVFTRLIAYRNMCKYEWN